MKLGIFFFSLFICCSICWAGVDFAGDDDSINAGSGSSVDNIWATGGTISVWLNLDSDGGGDEGRIIQKGDWEIDTVSEAGGKVKIFFWHKWSGTSLGCTTTNTVIDLNTWSHFVLTYDKSSAANNPVMYVNASSVATNDPTPTGTADTDAPHDWIIGNVASVRGFDGEMSDLAAWNVILTQAQIDQLYNSRLKGMPMQVAPANLKAYWPLNDICDGCDLAGASFLDRSGNGNTGTGSDANASGGQGRAESVLTYPRRR